MHDFEVYLRDHEMFEEAQSMSLDEDGQASDPGIGYRGSFNVDPKFNLQDSENLEPIKGYATPEGTKRYSQRSNIVHQSNFKKVKMCRFDEELTLSKLMIGTARGVDMP